MYVRIHILLIQGNSIKVLYLFYLNGLVLMTITHSNSKYIHMSLHMYILTKDSTIIVFSDKSIK